MPFTILPKEEEVPPPYGKSGRILIEVEYIERTGDGDEYGLVVHDYDDDTSVFWANEGVGIDWMIQHDLCLTFEEEGWYVLEGVEGRYHRGNGWDIEDEEEWSVDLVRRAAPEEIAARCLSDPEPQETK